MEIGEEWLLRYRLFAESSDPVEFALKVRRTTEGSVVVARILDAH